MVVISGLIAIWGGYQFGVGSGETALLLGIDPTMTPDVSMMDPNDPEVAAIASRMAARVSALMFTALTGLIGFIVSIVGFVQRKGRKFGLWGIILGFVFPIAVVIAVMMGMLPAISQLVP